MFRCFTLAEGTDDKDDLCAFLQNAATELIQS